MSLTVFLDLRGGVLCMDGEGEWVVRKDVSCMYTCLSVSWHWVGGVGGTDVRGLVSGTPAVVAVRNMRRMARMMMAGWGRDGVGISISIGIILVRYGVYLGWAVVWEERVFGFLLGENGVLANRVCMYVYILYMGYAGSDTDVRKY